MAPTLELLDALRREEIEDARQLSIEQKLAAGGDLFDQACQVTLSGIRMDNPGITPDKAYEVLRSRLDLARRLEMRRASS